METLLFSVLRRARLPLPVPQLWIDTRGGRRRLDYAYPQLKLALEVDSYAFHDFGRQGFDDDRARDTELAEAGWERRYLTSTMLRRTPSDVVWTVANALGLEPTGWRPRR